MPENKNVNKIVYGSTVLIDLTADTVTKDKILTVKVGEILKGQTAYARGTKLVGTMPILM